MKVAEIRKRFIEYFKSQGHTVVDSSPLIPENDPTLLFANAGMNQFKDIFTGKETRPYKRAVTCQKCVRAGGKHNDLENVGHTARHHTFFEMLGNFSFGDYFKEDAILFAWDFVTNHLKIDPKILYVTIHESDDEAEKIWLDKVGFPKSKLTRLDEDNFWAMGDVGPCGPCSEIFVDRGEEHGCGPACGIGKCECDRFMEIWNLVFMQFERDNDGNLNPLPKPSVDTGMGLERVAGVLQKTATNYEIDSMLEILNYVAELAGTNYDPEAKDVFNYRVIADHARSATFLISDGVIPSNEGRGYVLRRIIRRAVRYGRNIGFSEPFLYKVCAQVIAQMVEAYPSLTDRAKLIEKAVKAEEAQFFKTLERGLSLLDDELENLSQGGTLDGETAFKLYDTFGFPFDLTRIICEERGFLVDEAGFQEGMSKQKDQSRKNWKGSGSEQAKDIYHSLRERLATPPEFVGYETLSLTSECLAILQGDEEKYDVDFTQDTEHPVELVFAKTPFYPEGGGQVGDRGKITGENFSAQVLDVQKPVSDLIIVKAKIEKGSIRVGQSYEQSTDGYLRQLTARNHTATHMLHWALRDVLGDHVKQAGSLVNDELLRFDFSHFQSLTEQEWESIETIINQKIWLNLKVQYRYMSKDEAVSAGAIAFFGEKYGETVRVVSVGDFSIELCGGCHVSSTAEINLFKIVSESSIAAGVRRITAYTSEKAFQYLASQEKSIRRVKDTYKLTSLDDLTQRYDKAVAAEKELRKQWDQLRAKEVLGQIDELLKTAAQIGETKVLNYLCPEDEHGVKTMRDIAERLTQKESNLILMLGMKQTSSGKALLLAAKGKKAPSSFKAGDLIKRLSPLIDGRGGGKPDMAQAGGSLLEGVDKALASSFAEVEKILG